jgi:hypothetical protein
MSRPKPLPFFHPKAFLGSGQHDRRDDEGDEISKQRLLEGRKMAGLFDEQAHQRKTESRTNDEKDAQSMIVVAVFCK